MVVTSNTYNDPLSLSLHKNFNYMSFCSKDIDYQRVSTFFWTPLYIIRLQKKNGIASVQYTCPPWYQEQIHVTHPLGCHARFLDNVIVSLLPENGPYFWMFEMIMGTPHCVQAGVRTPCNSYMCVRQLYLIWRHVNTISCFLMKQFPLKGELPATKNNVNKS
jgi:hypothetical protein